MLSQVREKAEERRRYERVAPSGHVLVSISLSASA
jgi:hypothetical protein